MDLFSYTSCKKTNSASSEKREVDQMTWQHSHFQLGLNKPPNDYFISYEWIKYVLAVL
jgi:hypothetical protein